MENDKIFSNEVEWNIAKIPQKVVECRENNLKDKICIKTNSRTVKYR